MIHARAMPIRTLVLALGALASGCTTQPAYQMVGRANLTNADGHVVGHRQTIRDNGGAELAARTVLYSRWVNERGELLGYEERVAGGALLRNLQGEVVGERWTDMRSRGSNPGNGGLDVVISR